MYAWITAVFVILMLASSTAFAKDSKHKKPAETKKPVAADKIPKSIGIATMDSEGSIRMQLRSYGPGPQAEGSFEYKKTDPKYKDILKHLGGMKPGETKSVPPWPEDETQKKPQ